MAGIIFPERKSAKNDNPALFIWVIDDCFKIPEIPYFYEFHTKLEKALHKDGFDDSIQHRYLIVDPKTDSAEFLKSFESLYEHYFYHSIHLATESCRGNVVLISGNKNFGQGTKLAEVRDCLLKKGFNFVVVNPDTLPEID